MAASALRELEREGRDSEVEVPSGTDVERSKYLPLGLYQLWT